MTTMSTDVHLVDGEHGPYFMGNLQFPSTTEMHDLIIKVIPDDEGEDDSELMIKFRELLEQYGKGRFHWSVEIEPRRHRPRRNGDKRHT